MLSRLLHLLTGLCFLGTLHAVAAVILPSTNDLWDISQGSMVTATSGLNLGDDGRDMFGGQFGSDEQGRTIFADGKPAGFVHYVQWQTPGPVTVGSFVLFAAGDLQFSNQREFSQFVLKAKTTPSATNYDLTLYTLVVTNHPFNLVDPVNLAFLSANITPVRAQYFRAEFTQYTAGRGYDGPRIIELDGFAADPPVIVTQPASQTAVAGANATFSVTVTGTPPISYQWVENGSNVLATSTDTTLVLTNVQPGLSGNTYSVVVSNVFGVTNSTSAMLTVNPVVIPSTSDLWDISQGSVVTATSGAHGGFSDIRDMFGGTFSQTESGRTVFADGQPAGFVHYVEWQTPGPVTVGSFVLFAAGDPQSNNEREFSQFVLKAKSSPLATNYDLTLYTLVVTNHPFNLVDPANLAFVATNITPVTAQYFRAEFTQYTAGLGHDGPRIIELDGFGSNAPVPPTILTQPANQNVTAGANVTFAVTATGSAPLSYQWMENGSNVLMTETNPSLVLTNVQPGLSGNTYSVAVSNAFGATNSSGAMLTVIPPVIPSAGDLWDISQGSVITGTSGAHAPNSDIRDMFGGTFSQTESGRTVFADGQPAGFVHYVEWQTPGPVTVSSFDLFAAGDGPAANNAREFSQFVLKARSSPLATNYDLTLYTLVVTNHPFNLVDPASLAFVTANIAPVTAQYFRAEFTQYTSGQGYDGPRIIELDGFGSNPLTIVTQPTNLTAAVRANATFTVGATGTGPLSFQWLLNGTNISPNSNATATNVTLVLTNVQPNLSGNQYSVIVSNPSGSTNSVAALLTVADFLQVHYVYEGGTNPVSPFSSWATAATNIQDAVDAASAGDLVLVTNGVYAFGGGKSAGNSRVDITKLLTVESVNGPSLTIIRGNYALDSSGARCVTLSDGDILAGFTLTQGSAWMVSHGPPPPTDNGGGVLGWHGNSIVSNCVITGNASFSWGGGAGCGTSDEPATMTLYNCTLSSNIYVYEGGGAYGCTLVNCKLFGNSAPYSGYAVGGGAANCSLENCILVSNSAPNFDYGVLSSGGGAYNCKLDNCVLVGNVAWLGSNFDEASGDVLNYCCTSPLPANGFGNITNSPLFLNPAAGDFHLQPNSPCINAGYNAYVSTTNDLDGNPRISGGTVDIGAYEFQNPASIISYAWLQQYGLPTDGSADFLDPDHDGLNNWQEWLAGTNPINASSVLQMLSPTTTTNPPALVVTWQSAPNVTYYLQRATNLSAQLAFQPLATNLPGQAGTTSYTDTNAPAPGPYFYRVGVQHP